MKLLDFLKRRKKSNVITVPLPRKRVSSEEPSSLGSLILIAQSSLDIVNPKVPTNFLEIIEKFCIVNPDFSQALGNVVRLGNTGHEITVASGDEATIEAAAERLNKLAARINTDKLVNRLLRQVAVSGAISLEWVATSDLSGIDRAVLVPVSSIKFKYDKKADAYKPFQFVSRSNDYVELNELTYIYSAIETSDNSPYGIPPFVSALGSAVIQLYMMDNLKFIIKKLGLLGFISVALDMESIPQQPGESQDSYTQRLTSHLTEFATNFSENYRDGIAAHLDNMKIEHHNVAGDARGAKDILQMNEEQISSGLKTDPALLGRSYSTTETYAGVVYSMLIKQLENLQRIIKRAIEQGYRLDILMANIPVDDVSVHFNPNAALKPKEEAEAEAIRTDTAIAKMDAGIISPDDAARELGYEQAYGGSFEADTDKLQATLSFDGGRYRIKEIGFPAVLARRLPGSFGKKRKPERDPEGIIERRRQRWVNKYNGDVLQIDSLAIGEVVRDIKSRLVSLLGYSPEEFAEEVYSIVSELHPANLKKLGLEKKVIADVLIIYRHYRIRDQLISGKRIPIKLTLPDKRAISFLESLDDFHISKYVRNDGARKRVLNFLKTEHLEGRTAKINSFAKAFRNELGELSKSQVRRIVDTSVSRLRNWGHIRQMAEGRTGVAEVSEVMDSITCDLCRAMDGEFFRVSHADHKIGELSELSPDDYQKRVYDDAPWEYKYDPVAYAERHSIEDFIENDMVGPPFHAHCRGRLIAK